MATIRRVSALKLRLPFDHGAPPPLFAGKPRTTLDSGLIRIELDNGLIGWGEAYAPDPEALVSFVRSRIEPLLLGTDPEDPKTFAMLDRTLHNMGRSGLVAQAISGVDIALWDLRGKLQGLPVYTLLGGARRTFIPAYASLLQYYGDVERVKRNVASSLEAGYGEVKLHERSVAVTAAAREVMGADLPLMLDTNCAWTADEVRREVAAYEPLNLHWIEEPIWPPEDLTALAALRESIRIPLAAGENASSRFELTEMARRGLVDYLQPSALKAGGITALWQLSQQCAGTPVNLAPQSAFFGPGFLATLHVLAAQAQPVAVERLFCSLGHVPYAESIPFVRGGFQLSDRPGLGADPEPELLASAFVSA
ncbi:mandelate racemase/muconate lactonizing enzyme family protein [Hydrogenophaga sp.]|uniref:mandelate racemase/muconate lactonizing enzyme family protein n=1 Tax=Hydrogenophaga sp. TaxID=1904254 RepID=UPI002721F1BC|nr:mandelate racemase/muconate lactonizing enzyme family protein [Hydrogenophaga sp.]MDO9436543.1 mandelate racemase/muconate lactonizing enzyme family protein [Hydrogenophaga sp.]